MTFLLIYVILVLLFTGMQVEVTESANLKTFFSGGEDSKLHLYMFSMFTAVWLAGV